MSAVHDCLSRIWPFGTVRGVRLHGQERMGDEHGRAGHQKHVGKVENGPMERAEREEQEVADGRNGGSVTVAAAVQTDAIVKVSECSAQNQGQSDRQPEAARGGETEQPHGNPHDGRQTQPGEQPGIFLSQSPKRAPIETGQKPKRHPAVEIRDALPLPSRRKGKAVVLSHEGCLRLGSGIAEVVEDDRFGVEIDRESDGRHKQENEQSIRGDPAHAHGERFSRFRSHSTQFLA